MAEEATATPTAVAPEEAPAEPTAVPAPAASTPAPAAASAFDALAGTRPRVRRDVLFTETPGGVLFHNADGGFHLTGRSAYRFASLMVPHLAGHHRLGDICQGFGPAQRAMAAELVKTLYERGFARDIPEDETAAPEAAPGTPAGAHTLTDAVGTRFAAQIAYADHYADGAPARFLRYRTTRVAILGTGPVARWCALSLVRNGGSHLAVEGAETAGDPVLTAEIAELAAQDCPVTLDTLPAHPGWPALDGYDIVVVTGADASPRTHALLSAGVPEGTTLIPAWTFGRRSVTGPLSRAGSAGCWSCAVLRLGGNTDAGTAADIWSEVAGGAVAGASGRSAPTGPVAAMSGNLLGYEVFRLTTGVLPAETDGQVLVQDLESLDVMAEPVQPHPRCALCAPAARTPRPALPGGLTLPVTPTVESAGEAEALVEGLNRISSVLVRPFTGIFARYDDESLTQTPLKISRVELAVGHGPRRAVAAFDVHHLAGARLRALYAAAETYVEHVVPVVPGAGDPADGIPALGPDRLTTGSGTTTGTEAVRAWVTATSLLTKEPVRVPAAAVRPFGPYNADRLHQPTTAGAGAGPGPQEAAGRGLLSALAHGALLRAVRGEAPGALVTSPAAGEPDADPELVFLLKSVPNVGIGAELVDLGEREHSGAHVVLARETDGADGTGGRGRWAVAAGLSRTGAACAALRDLLGQVQLAAEEPESAVDLGDPLMRDLAAATVPVTAGPVAADATATTFDAVLDRLRAAGRDVLYIDTTPADLPSGGISTARVLLTTASTGGADAEGAPDAG
ncbi:TOMM precursor leader peptide-binding protein [Streptomyces sp. NBC_01498]|uniref:TOMM precursor leader peptide-binding protein n=1 Tax=Streptomyces sp. NBC_01498 TaxID=2975870 RepID=UPI002E7AB53B|nr:TOMM precursor leader peptide-binding protein [Streptomyces sp. NBC_01498]WTL26472.1 TOMM precursor leader peptide-binding protein [Streptomyces sp. NBC_01498]